MSRKRMLGIRKSMGSCTCDDCNRKNNTVRLYEMDEGDTDEDMIRWYTDVIFLKRREPSDLYNSEFY